jgi:transposase-like protein
LKTLAVLLYGMGNASYRMIARLLGISHVAVYGWIRTEAAKLPEPEMTGETIVLSIYFSLTISCIFPIIEY